MTTANIFTMAEWRVAEGSDGCYVIETTADTNGHVQYGPMPEEWVLQVISERRSFYEEILKRRSQYLFDHSRT